ncbi:MAG: hypothetical protein QGI83_20350 [Candidatus Latescibacteria bacterium]|jgi:hypothetical protein|nr:hypothetical protein [Candidatus Latescibacterota bacterium]
MSDVPFIGGQTGFGGTALQLINLTERQVNEVANFRTRVRNYSAPRMELASSIPTPTFAEQGSLANYLA